MELPLILSDHADWPDPLHTLKQISPKEVWITHGREDALLHACNKLGIEPVLCLWSGMKRKLNESIF